jgi:polar amino acid transport system substrate-binding protein
MAMENPVKTGSRSKARRVTISPRRFCAVAVVSTALLYPSLSTKAAPAPPEIATAGEIVVCADIGSPPLSFYDQSGKVIGAEVELATAIAARMGVKAEFRKVQFDDIIPALLAKQCDVIMSELYDKPARREVVDFVDYLRSSQSLVVLKGNPHQIHTLVDLSGKKVAVENGTTIQSLVDEQNKKFIAAGKPLATVVVFPSDTDAFQALRIGQVDAYGTTIKTAGYYFLHAPDLFEIGGPPFNQATIGAAFRKSDKPLQDAYAASLKAVIADGTYIKILKEWNIERDAIN